ncbi:MAG TPA: class I SAM-dependent methyltransferase [Phycisphaerales bacterium]|nr:class I SAM-dependent methyltransferase [Phycisphaerales bacterium]
MPTSAWHYITPIMQFISDLNRARPVRRVLDVGCGSGKWGFLTRELLDFYSNAVYYRADWKVRIEGIEIFERYRNPVHEYVYDRVHWGDAVEIVEGLDEFDVIIAMEVIEHLTKDRGELLLRRLIARADRAVILSFPPEVDAAGDHIFSQQTVHGNVHETHRSIWTEADLSAYTFRRLAAQAYGITARMPPPRLAGSSGLWTNERGVRILTGAGSFAEFELAPGSRLLELEVLKHPWSAAIAIRDPAGATLHEEDLFAREGEIQCVKVMLPPALGAVRIDVRSNERSQGAEAWLHALRTM